MYNYNVILTVDIGTSVFKTAIWDFDGRRISYAASDLTFTQSEGLRYETDSALWLKAFENCCGRLSGDVKLSSADAVVLCGNGPSLTPVLADPVFSAGSLSVKTAPVRLWLDKRAKQAAKEVSALSGGFVDPCFFLPKVLDIKTNEPLLYDKTKFFLGCPEFLAFALTGEARTIFPSGGFERWFWNDEILSRLGLGSEKFPPFIRPGETFGTLAMQAASCFGLKPDIPVICGGPDFFAAILGCGTAKPAVACDRTGTSTGINVCTKTQISNERFMSYAHPVKPYWNLSGVISTTGKAIEWASNILGLKDIDSFFALAETAPAGAGGLVFLPFLTGGCAVNKNSSPSSSGGMFKGLNLFTGRPEIARSVIEGINFAIRDIADEMIKAGAVINELRVAGSVFKNNFLNQIKADILQRPVLVPQQKEAELMGLALIGSCACGKYASFSEAVSALVKIEKTFLPDTSKAALYNEMY